MEVCVSVTRLTVVCTDKDDADGSGQQEQTMCQMGRRVVMELQWPAPTAAFPLAPAELRPRHRFQIPQRRENRRHDETEDIKTWR